MNAPPQSLHPNPFAAVPPEVNQRFPSARPWPVVLLTALGAWLAAVPIMVAVYELLGDRLTQGVTPYIVGVLALGAALVVLRSASAPIFLEQLAVPALMVGLGTLGMAIHNDLPAAGGRALMLCVVTALAWALPKDWLRVLLGAGAAALLGDLLSSVNCCGSWRPSEFWLLHGVLLVWLGLAAWRLRPTAAAAWLEPFNAGWLLAVLVGLVALTGRTFLVGGNAVEQTGASWVVANGSHSTESLLRQGLSALLAVASFAVALRAWPVLRSGQPMVQAGVVATVVAALAWFMPTLGAACLALMVTASLHRWRLAAACAVAAAWVVGAFYYQLQWPLGDKALLMMLAGTILGGLAWLSHRRDPPVHVSETHPPGPTTAISRQRLAVWAIALGTVLTLVVANVAIWQKQHLIANGKRIYIELAPADPRSLMQGDFMRLRFAALSVPEPLRSSLRGQRPHMVMQLDQQGIAKPLRLHGPEQVLAPGEMLLQLTRKDGGWVVVTDAWFFQEGQAGMWQAAKFGEFRVLPDGRALLVSLADENLKAIQP